MIALVNIVSKFRGVNDSTRPPSGLLFVGGALKKAGHDVKIFHISDDEIDSAVEQIIAHNPLYVGFSVFTGFPCYASAVMSEKLKKINPEILIVWGGVHPSLDAVNCLKEPYVDLVVIGEGEETVVELTNAVISKKTYSGIKGVGYKNGENIIINDRREQINLDSYKMDWSLVDINKYLRPGENNGKSICFMTSRGCPYNCGFCYNGQFHMRKWRAHSIDFVIDEISKIKEQTGITSVSFDDDHFMVNQKRGIEILTRLKKIGIRCDWLELRVESVNHDLFKILSDLEVFRILFGWESGSDRILKLINKNFTKDIIIEKAKILAQYPNIRYDASAIIGFPTETRHEIQKTIETAIEMAELSPNFNFNLGTYLPYPGTKLYQLAINEGLVPPKDAKGWKDFDILEFNTELTWLKWANKNTRRELYLIDKYSHFFDRTAADSSGKVLKKVKKAVKTLFYIAAKFRLKHKIFVWPIEIYFQIWRLRRGVKRNIEKYSVKNT